jgi:hypothetical protein
MKRYNIFRKWGHPQYIMPAGENDLSRDEIEWVFDWSVKETFYQDEDIKNVFFDKGSTKKYAWINESAEINPLPYNMLLLDFDKYIQEFDMIFTHHGDIVKMHEKIKWIPLSQIWIKNPAIYQKSKLVSMITSNKALCPQHIVRLDWMHKLKNNIDVFGHGINPIPHKEIGLCEYMFSICIENSLYNSSFTEKILDCFATGTIPVYIGPSDVTDFFNGDGIIFLNDNFDLSSLTPELYYSKMDAIKDNFERVQKYKSVDNCIYEYLKGNNDNNI